MAPTGRSGASRASSRQRDGAQPYERYVEEGDEEAGAARPSSRASHLTGLPGTGTHSSPSKRPGRGSSSSHGASGASSSNRTPSKKKNRVAPVPVAENKLIDARPGIGDDDDDDLHPHKQLLAMSQRLPPLELPTTTVNAPPDYVLRDKTGRVPIRVRVHIMSLQNVSTVDQSFNVKLWLQMAWITERRDISSMDFNTEWKPRLDFLDSEGAADIMVSGVPRELHCDDPNKMIISCRWVVNGTFSEKMELQDFPFDHQKLHIRAAAWDVPSYVVTNPDDVDGPVMRRAFEGSLKFYRGQSFVYDEAFVQSDAWDLDPSLSIEQDYSRHERHDEHYQYPILNIFVIVARRSSFFIYNIGIPILLLVIMSFISFLFPVEELEPRMTVTLTIVLTLVALKFVVAQYLPLTSYLTKLDWYVLMSFGLTFAVAVQNSLVYYIGGDVGETWNLWSGWILAGIWGLVNVVAVVMCGYLIFNHDRYLNVYSYRDWEARPLPLIDSIDHSRFPFPKIVDRSDIAVARHKMINRALSKRPKRVGTADSSDRL